MPITTTTLEIDRLALLRLMQLASPALPVGAFAYSQGLESAAAAGWVRDEATAGAWITGLLASQLAGLDLPILARMQRAWEGDDEDAVEEWNALLLACRPTAELAAEDRQLGASLARLLAALEVRPAERWAGRGGVSYAAMFALAAARWRVPEEAACAGHAFAWLEAQTSAAVRLVPLGQSAGQRILAAAGAAVPDAVARARALADDEVGAAAPGQAIASAWHETQYSRLFRS
jgi:urease accessory protein